MTKRTLVIIVEDTLEEMERAVKAVVCNLSIDEVIGREAIENYKKVGERSHNLFFFINPSELRISFLLYNSTSFLKDHIPHIGFGWDKKVVLTDLMLPTSSGSPTNANGLSVVMWSLKNKIPIGICSDTDHHDVAFLSDIKPLLDKEAGYIIPSCLDSKNWDKIVKETFAII